MILLIHEICVFGVAEVVAARDCFDEYIPRK